MKLDVSTVILSQVPISRVSASVRAMEKDTSAIAKEVTKDASERYIFNLNIVWLQMVDECSLPWDGSMNVMGSVQVHKEVIFAHCPEGEMGNPNIKNDCYQTLCLNIKRRSKKAIESQDLSTNSCRH